MPRITFLPSRISIEAPAGTVLLDAAKKAGLSVESPCGGKGTCGKCMVRIVQGHVDETPSSDGEWVRACVTKTTHEDVTIDIPEQSLAIAGTFSDANDSHRLIDPSLLPDMGALSPLSQSISITVPLPRIDDGLSDLDRFTRALGTALAGQKIDTPLSVIQNLGDTLRAHDGQVFVVYAVVHDRIRILRVASDHESVATYGLAIDIGTTTIAVQIVDAVRGEIIATRSEYNQQISCGLDVISRITYAQRPDRLDELRQKVLATINQLIAGACADHTIAALHICSAVISGNTTMIHLLLGINPQHIRLAPYTPAIHSVPLLTASNIGIRINPTACIHISPAIGSYVGGDITAGILCTGLARHHERIQVFIDIGTNGELIIGNGEFLIGCACSAGPAFEGGGIDCGMRACDGAIDRVEIDHSTGLPTIRSIGSGKPRGICGTGMISLLANLLRSGWIDRAGKLDRSRPCETIKIDGRFARYQLVDRSRSATGKPLEISESDIDNIIRAKAAIYSACTVVLEEIGVAFADVDRYYIGGGFGRFLDLDDAITIGLLPDIDRSKFSYIGNSSLVGSWMLLLSEPHRRLQQELAQKITYKDLSSDASYMSHYTAALFLPHTDERLFPSFAV